jgi:hypothetical protein
MADKRPVEVVETVSDQRISSVGDCSDDREVLIESGVSVESGIFMIQWFAPLASQSPELVVVAYLVNKARSISQTLHTPDVQSPTTAPRPILITVSLSGISERYAPTVFPQHR